MTFPKGKTIAEVAGIPGWCSRCIVREGTYCKQYDKSCIIAREDNSCIRRPRVDRVSSCDGNELGRVHGLHRMDWQEYDLYFFRRDLKARKGKKIIL